VSKKEIFKNFIIEEIEETILDGNLKKLDFRKLSWTSTDNDNIDFDNSSISLGRIKLVPMEIRTFIIRLKVAIKK